MREQQEVCWEPQRLSERLMKLQVDKLTGKLRFMLYKNTLSMW